MNIRLFLSEVRGSSEIVIETIEQCLKDKQPFGLRCQRSSVVFIPRVLKAYWLWSDNEAGPVFQCTNVTDFLNTVKIQYMTHRQLISTDELVAMAKLIQYEYQNKRLAAIQQNILPEPEQPARSVEAG